MFFHRLSQEGHLEHGALVAQADEQLVVLGLALRQVAAQQVHKTLCLALRCETDEHVRI